MIKYALVCDQDHPFEGWFSVSADFDDQKSRGLLECPMCGSAEVSKQIMAPAVTGTRAQSRGLEGRGTDAGGAGANPQMRAMMMEAMGRVRAHVEENFDNMGDRFADEARAIHEGRSEERGIYGQATAKEVRDLVQDGVPVAPMPPAGPRKDELN